MKGAVLSEPLPTRRAAIVFLFNTCVSLCSVRWLPSAEGISANVASVRDAPIAPERDEVKESGLGVLPATCRQIQIGASVAEPEVCEFNVFSLAPRVGAPTLSHLTQPSHPHTPSQTSHTPHTPLTHTSLTHLIASRDTLPTPPTSQGFHTLTLSHYPHTLLHTSHTSRTPHTSHTSHSFTPVGLQPSAIVAINRVASLPLCFLDKVPTIE
jgi:hypothetical protein